MNYKNILWVYLLIYSTTLFGQTEKTYEYTIETSMMNCIFGATKDNGANIKAKLKKSEDVLIANGFLKDGSGESYRSLFKDVSQLVKQKNIIEQLEILTLFNQLNKGIGLDLSALGECIENVMFNEEFQKSKIVSVETELNKMDVLKNEEKLKAVLELMNAKDFEHDFYKVSFFSATDRLYRHLTNTKRGISEELTKVEEVEKTPVPEHTFEVYITKHNTILGKDGKEIKLSNLKKEVTNYLKTYGSENRIIIKNDRETEYKTYISAQNEILGAFNHVRNDLAKKKYKKGYEELNAEQQKEIRNTYPQNISESETQN